MHAHRGGIGASCVLVIKNSVVVLLFRHAERRAAQPENAEEKVIHREIRPYIIGSANTQKDNRRHREHRCYAANLRFFDVLIIDSPMAKPYEKE